jgi:succinate-semialdehyde dehydrogenase/glutarate-semialdehyde dehydrogenase
LISDAINSGATLLYGGNRIDMDGNYFEPTIIELPIDSNCIISREEIFGPVLVLYKFKSDDEVIKFANNTDSGLAAYIYSNNQKRIEKVTKLLEYGMIGINECSISIESAPFGGIKESGFGREGSYLGIYEYLNVKYILYQ